MSSYPPSLALWIGSKSTRKAWHLPLVPHIDILKLQRVDPSIQWFNPSQVSCGVGQISCPCGDGENFPSRNISKYLEIRKESPEMRGGSQRWSKDDTTYIKYLLVKMHWLLSWPTGNWTALEIINDEPDIAQMKSTRYESAECKKA